MYQNLQVYLNELYSTIMKQDKRIQNLEKLVSELTTNLNELKKNPAIRVDKIEYKFDQLKVETLEGTLNIGLNPSDLQGIESFEVDNKSTNATVIPKDPKGLFRHSMELEEEVYQLLDTDLPKLIQNAEARMNQKLDENHYNFIKEDIKKQIPARIQHHIQHSPFKGNDSQRNDWKHDIVQKLFKEMENGICTFIKNLPDNTKGMKDD